jgi:hypothetical protein
MLFRLVVKGFINFTQPGWLRVFPSTEWGREGNYLHIGTGQYKQDVNECCSDISGVILLRWLTAMIGDDDPPAFYLLQE